MVVKEPKVIIIGAGAAGLMCAISAASSGKKVVVLDHAKQVAGKILMSGGGRCNFTNYDIDANNYLSHNPHFCKSALSRYTQWDFIALVEKHQIAYEERKHGQLFCKNSAKDVVKMLLSECESLGVKIETKCSVTKLYKSEELYYLMTNKGSMDCESLVIATGGLSIPTMGATGFGYQIAKQFGHNIYPQIPALVPFTLNPKMLKDFDGLSGTAVNVSVSCNNQSFNEAMLFTHRGLSGPAILQISSYWQAGDEITINLLPDIDIYSYLKQTQSSHPTQILSQILSKIFTKKLAMILCALWFEEFYQQAIAEVSDKELQQVKQQLEFWHFKPSGSEGYRTAEVTMGGIDTNEISSKTFESKKSSGLYFVGEVLDVTGHLGGYNFQWAWSSGWACGQSV